MRVSAEQAHVVLYAAVGTAVGLALLVLALGRADWEAVTAALGGARLWPWLPLAVGSYLLGHVARGQRCRLLVSGHVELGLASASHVVVLGYAANNVVPARLGEVARVALLAERGGLPATQALAVTVLERLLDVLAIVALLALAVVWIELGPGEGFLVELEATLPVGPLLAILAVVAVAAAGFAGLAAISPTRLRAAVSRRTGRLAPRLRERLAEQALFLAAAASRLRGPRAWTRILGWSLAVWTCETGLFLFLLPALALPPYLPWALLAMAVTNVALALPTSPGYFGTFHFFCMQALVAVGVGRDVAVGYAVVVHLAFFVPITLWGLLVMTIYGVGPASLWSWRRRMRRRSGAAPERAERERAEPPPSRFLGALCEAAIHRAVVELDAESRRRVAGEVRAFVAGQLKALPRRLRGLFHLGTLGFRTLTALRTLRPFTALPAARRAALFESWAYGRVGLARQLFRVVRSTALLAGYEHPAIRGRLGVPETSPPSSSRQEGDRGAAELPAFPRAVEVLVIGSGAGGAVTARVLAERGFEVLVVEEGARHALGDYGRPPPAALRDLYRQRGMTPLLGRVPVGFAEGCCVGGSTEVNSGFWHRTPRETLIRWHAAFELDGASPAEMDPHFEWAESALGVARHAHAWPPSTQLFASGGEAMGWSVEEVPRAAARCIGTNACAHGCPVGAKRGMSVSLLPEAEAHGARILPRARVLALLSRRRRIDGVVASLERPDGGREIVRIDAEHVFMCGGATQSPLLLRRSGIRLHVGNTLNVHPMLKATALFDEAVDAHSSVLPLVQVREFRPELSMGGAFFSLGHLALLLSDDWPEHHALMERHRHLASYYVAVPGTGRGTVRPELFGGDRAVLSYGLTGWELRNLSRGLARLALLLLAAGARAVVPAGHGLPVIRSEREAARWLDDVLPAADLSLTTVHAFSSCPAGERRDRCAVDSYGRVYGFENLRINDASILPDSPGVNPQGTVMAMARRNALAFAAEARR